MNKYCIEILASVPPRVYEKVRTQMELDHEKVFNI